MAGISQQIDEIVSRWKSLATSAVVEAVTADFYAAGFWLFYVDYSVFGVPCLALNTEENLNDENSEYARWSPPEWLIDVHPCYEEIQPLYTKLSALLEDRPEELWESTIAQHYDAMSDLCRKLTEEYHAGVGEFGLIDRNPDFVFGIFEEREGEELYEALAEKSISPARRASLEGL